MALQWASLHNDASLIRNLIEKGAQGNIEDSDGLTELMWAAYGSSENYLKVIQCLLSSRADASAKDHDGKTVLEHTPAEFRLSVENIIESQNAYHRGLK